MIDQDRAATQQLGLACLEEGVAGAMAETLCEGVRALLSTAVSLIVVVRAEAPLDARVAYELSGFRVLSRPPRAPSSPRRSNRRSPSRPRWRAASTPRAQR